MTTLLELTARLEYRAEEAKLIGATGYLRPTMYFYGRAFAFEVAFEELCGTAPALDSLDRLAYWWGTLALDVRAEGSERQGDIPPDWYAYYTGVADGLESAAEELRDLIDSMMRVHRSNGSSN